MKRKMRAGVALVLATSLLAACGSDDGDSTESTGAPEATTAQPADTEVPADTEAPGDTEAPAEPTGEPIVLYSVIPMSGGVDLNPLRVGGEVAAAAVNAAGGINGRPLEFVACDNKTSPSDSDACGREAVEAGATALVMSQDAFGGGITQASAAGIPSIANCICSAGDATDPLSFPTANGTVTQAAHGVVAGVLGAETVAAVLFDGAAGDVIASNVELGLAPYDLKIDIPVKIPLTAGDLSPYIAQMSEADAIVLISSPATVLNLVRGLDQSGYDGILISSSSTAPIDGIQELGAAADGMYIVSGGLPSTEEGNPAIDQFNAEFDEFGDDSVVRTGYAVDAWANVHMLAEVMKGMDTVDSASLVEELASVGKVSYAGMELGDFSEPVAEWLPVRNFSNVFYAWRAEGGDVKAVSDQPFDIRNPPDSFG